MKRHSRYLVNIQEHQVISKLFYQQLLDLIKKLMAKCKKSTGISNNAKKVDGMQFYQQYENKDLNKLDEEALKKEKLKMDTVFHQNVKKPGDIGYEYDVQKEFSPYEDNEWDEEDEDDELDEYI